MADDTTAPTAADTAAQPLTRDSAKARRAPVLLERLLAAYGELTTELTHANPLELLVATILSAQSTDRQVNAITPALFAKYRSPQDYLAVPEEELQQDVFQTGFYRQKARAIRGVCAALIERFDGEVPLSIADLVSLPGVARKTANVVLGEAAPQRHHDDPDAGIAVDTHVQRLSRRLGLTRQTNPDRIERDLQRLFPREYWPQTSLALILHGRRVCAARRPRCADCALEELCPSSLAAGRRDRAGQAVGMGE